MFQEDAIGIITNAGKSTPESEYYTTQLNDEIITFNDPQTNELVFINDWVIFTDTTDLKIKMITDLKWCFII
jgi:hypothetical protein